MSSSLLTKYRPKNLKDVIGHDSVIASYERALEKRSTHAFLFCGPSGIGKTTLAYIGARQLGAHVVEVKAAVHAGIDDVRRLIDDINYMPLGSKYIAVVMEEVQALSKVVWQALLKEFEDPPAHAFWFLTTTEMNKVPKAVQTRSAMYQLKPVSLKTIEKLLVKVCKEEKIDIPDDVLTLCAERADGSPRQALANLVICEAVEDVEEAEGMLASIGVSTTAIDLARVIGGRRWPEIAKVLRGFDDQIDPEGVRRVICSYYTKVALGAADQRKARDAAAVLRAFSQPFPAGSALSALIDASARVAFGDRD